MNEDVDQPANVTLRLDGKEEAEPICNMLRGLLLSSGTVELKGITNSRLLRGHAIAFGSAVAARAFVTHVETLFSRRVRDRLEIELND